MWITLGNISVIGFQFSVFRLRFISCQCTGYTYCMIKDVTDLAVYCLALENLEPLYQLVRLLPQEHRRLRYQVTEAGEKIAPQIAEGFGKKRSPREFCRFLSMALGSSDEVITHIREIIIVAKTYKKISIDDCEALIDRYKKLSKMLNKLLSSWLRYT